MTLLLLLLNSLLLDAFLQLLQLVKGIFSSWTLTMPSYTTILMRKFMSPPPGYSTPTTTPVCRLQKSIYGLKQASRNWFFKLCFILLVAGFTQSQADHSLFKLYQGQSSTFILICVDDILIPGNDLYAINNFKTMLAHHFHIKDLGKLKYFLGLEVAHSPTGIFLNQCKYALDILADSGHLGTRPTTFPMEQNLKLNNVDGDLLPDPSSFR